MIPEKRQINTKRACPHCYAKRCRRGFSLLEVIIAIFVLTIGITGALKLIVSTLTNSINTRNAVIASGLAQEGVELVRNIRDNNMLYVLDNLSRDRETNFSGHGFPVYPNNFNCVFDYTYNYALPTNCGASVADNAPDTELYIDSFGYYAHLGVTKTAFRRYVKFVYDTKGFDAYLNKPPVGVTVTSYVWWGASKPANCNLASKCISVSDYLPKRD